MWFLVFVGCVIASDKVKSNWDSFAVKGFFQNNSKKFSGNDSTGFDGDGFAPCHIAHGISDFPAPLKSKQAFVTDKMPPEIGAKFLFCSVNYWMPDIHEADKQSLSFARANDSNPLPDIRAERVCPSCFNCLLS